MAKKLLNFIKQAKGSIPAVDGTSSIHIWMKKTCSGKRGPGLKTDKPHLDSS